MIQDVSKRDPERVGLPKEREKSYFGGCCYYQLDFGEKFVGDCKLFCRVLGGMILLKDLSSGLFQLE